MEQIVAFLRRRPELLDINAGMESQYAERTRNLVKLEYEQNGKLYKVEV